MKYIIVKQHHPYEDSSTLTMDRLTEWNANSNEGNVIVQLPPNPEKNLVIDPRPGRPIYWDKDGYTFDVKVTPASNNNNDYGEVTFHRTDDNGGWRNDIYFRAYFLNEEEKDPRPFDNSVPYLYEEDQYQPIMISSKGLLRKTSGHLRKHLENARSW